MNRADADPRIRRELPTEYWFYFVPIFLTALPAAFVHWTIAHARGTRTNPGPLRRAMSTAHCITPEIFSA